ncbi:MAG TPA: branched-chain amino acid ABC transporter permease [Burkholderiales bacterium]|nr:branched-chain amino acid ABC transporter permease [Burkholderiales bacterium]
MTTTQATAPAGFPITARSAVDWIPLALVPVLALAALPLVGSVPTWVTLTVAGLAMGMMIFMMASGLTLVFGLMDVMNFAHGIFISVGAYGAATVLTRMRPQMEAGTLTSDLSAMVPAVLAAIALAGFLGWFFERVLIRPVYGDHLKQILITMGGLIVFEQLIHVVWGPDIIPLPRPSAITGAFILGDAAIERYRVLAVIVGLAVFAAMWLLLNRTKIGLLVRAGVENPEMVESLGYRIKRLFVGVFVAGSGLAGLGGAMWAMYQEQVTAQMGMQVLVVIFIVVIIGGLGSVGGCFVGAMLVGLMANYTGYLAPKLALGSNILLMVLILLWRPRGLYAIGKA